MSGGLDRRDKPSDQVKQTDPCNEKYDRWLSLPPTGQDLTQGKWPEGRIIVVAKGEGRRARAETRTLLDYAGNRLT